MTMQWIHHYQLFLFDFDGLLVNTEHLHYQAYLRMCAQRGFTLNWSFQRYSDAAHHQPTALRDQIYAEFPALQAQEPNWSVLYEDKKRAFLALLQEGAAQLMPGVHSLLLALQQADIRRCVVTHSPLAVIQTIREQNPILDTIPYWITREDYTHPKPHPECYQLAIKRYAREDDRIIGFEDSPRGLNALLQTPAKAVLICPPDSPYLNQTLVSHLCYYPTFTAIQSTP
ncbi:HAD family hydrolase [Candidatus Protochlamydia phocaeensis]|uniref:HAD family hydrolase n=1 Tax=Candidatus Protochlamydia phocaeensis TaxID=1414722 RepID=UPI000A6FB906|nr:HAD family phosphatase [Candidatus Protochlamydia phocaeensis]